MELVTGASGYVGGLLVDRLVREGRAVRALARNPARFAPQEGVEVVRGNLVEGTGLAEALEGCSTAYYLVHSLRAGPRDAVDFRSRDRIAAHNFGQAAADAGLERIVYLGGLAPGDAPPSGHLASRLEVERTLMEAVPGSTALRASIIIGAGSSSFRIVVRLVERLRIVPFPGWRDRRTQPIDERDVLEYLALTPLTGAAAGRSLDIAGPDVLSYAEMIERIAEVMAVWRAPLRLASSHTPATSAVVARLTGQPVELVRALMESLEYDLLPRDNAAAAIYGVTPRSFDRAVEHALREWEQIEELAAR